MIKILKYISAIFLILTITSCTSTIKNYDYVSKDKVVYLKKDNNTLFPLKLTNPSFEYKHSFCVDESYTLLDDNKIYGKLFIESITLSFNCNWSGLSIGFFESNLKSSLNLDSFEVVENIDITSYNFKTYKVNNDSYLSVIYIYGFNTDRFILDYNGKLYQELLKYFNINSKNKFYLEKRFIGNYKDSLVRKNIINHYFYQEREPLELKP